MDRAGLITLEQARAAGLSFDEPEPRACPHCGAALEPVSVNVFFAIFTNFLCQARQRGAPFAPTYFRHPGYSRSGICGRVRYLYLAQ